MDQVHGVVHGRQGTLLGLFVCFETTMGQLAQWPPSNTTWFVLYVTTTGQLAQIWRTMKKRPRPGWRTRSRNGTHFPQALISSYEILQQCREITYRENTSNTTSSSLFVIWPLMHGTNYRTLLGRLTPYLCLNRNSNSLRLIGRILSLILLFFLFFLFLSFI